MTLRLACDECGPQPCACYSEECRACDGEGIIWNNADPTSGQWCDCPDCHGEGWIKCNRGGVNCRFDHCYCEAAWERQQADYASEPPTSADERHQLAWQQKQELRR